MKSCILAFTILFLSSCASSLFSVDKNSDITNINTTVGEELIDLILNNEYNNSADLNLDDTVDILDVVQLVNIILN